MKIYRYITKNNLDACFVEAVLKFSFAFFKWSELNVEYCI